MTKLLTLPTGRRAKWVVAVVWLLAIVGASAANLPAKYADAENNESTSFLPGDAESTKALAVTEELQGGEQAAPVVIYRREGGLTEADRQKVASDREALNQAMEKYPQVDPFGEPQFSEEGDAALLIGNITGDGESETILDPVDEMRELVSDPGGGLEVKVTGPAGFAADAIKVFESINGTLLLAAAGIVFFLLILIYRSPLFFWIPLIAVAFAELGTRAVGYGLTELGVTVNGQSSSILSVLVLGAGTDYALLLVSRYREELRKHEDKHEAIALAMRTAGPAIVASGSTVIAALLCLSLAEVEGTAGLGPIGALGIAIAMISMLTILPAMLAITGRRAFWRPSMFGAGNGIPHFGDEGADEMHGTWRRVGNRVAQEPAAGVDRHRGDARGAERRRPHDGHRAHAERRLPRGGRVDPGPGAACAVVPRRRQRRDRDPRAAGRRRWRRSRAPPRASTAWPRCSPPARARATCSSTPCSSPTRTRPRPTTSSNRCASP